jgi:hypothetical protein
MPTKFTREYLFSDGVKSIWEFDLEKQPNGPIKTTISYPENSKHREKILQEENSKLPLTKQKFWNTATGKEISYQRAKQLGII